MIFRTHSENAILMKILKSYWKYAKPNLRNYLFSISRILFNIPASSHRAAHAFLKICSFMFQDREIFFPQEKSSYFPLNVTRFLFFFRKHSVSIFASRKWGNILHYFTLISWSVLLWMLSSVESTAWVKGGRNELWVTPGDLYSLANGLFVSSFFPPV